MPATQLNPMFKNVVGSGRSSVMSVLAKAASKYRTKNPNSQSFVETQAKREHTNEDAYKTTFSTSESNNLKSFLSKFTRNVPKGVKDEKNTESDTKASLSCKFKFKVFYNRNLYYDI